MLLDTHTPDVLCLCALRMNKAAAVNQELISELDKVQVPLTNVHNRKPYLSPLRAHHTRAQRSKH